MAPIEDELPGDEIVACRYPAIEPPVPVELIRLEPHACPYLPGRESTLRAFYAPDMPGLIYHDFMNASFRRTGRVIYQQVCAGCRACMPLRVPVDRFCASKSQRRCRGRNQELVMTVGEPVATDEKFALYTRYQLARHDSPCIDGRSAFESFLYDSPVETLEFSYRDKMGRLLGVGICDICPKSLSSVYFFYDPGETSRGLGTYGALCEIDFAAGEGIPYYYLGYWVRGCRKMEYKGDFRPCQILHPDGCWREGIE